jgi:hypothetical protein
MRGSIKSALIVKNNSMPVGMEVVVRWGPGAALATPHLYLSSFLLTFDSVYYILIHSNLMKTNEIVRMR